MTYYFNKIQKNEESMSMDALTVVFGKTKGIKQSFVWLCHFGNMFKVLIPSERNMQASNRKNRSNYKFLAVYYEILPFVYYCSSILRTNYS